MNQLYNKVEQVNTLLEGLVWLAGRKIQLIELQRLVDSHDVPEETLVLILNGLTAGRSWEALARESYVAELNFMKLASKSLKNGDGMLDSPDKKVHEFLRHNLFYQGCFPFFEYWVNNLSTPLSDIPKPSPLEELELNKGDYFYLLMNRESILHLMILPALEIAGEKFRQLSGFEDLLRLRVASLLYHREYGHLPKTINDLVPKYLSKVPRDVYSGEEIIYDGENARFYFCGPDLKDDKGQFTKKLMQQLNYEGDIVQYIFVQEQEVEEIKEKTSPISKFSKARLNRK